MVKTRLPMQETQETWAQSLSWEYPLDKEVPASLFMPGESQGQMSLAG